MSQMGQDFWVFGEVFNEKEGGYFIDVGSADGLFFNNTFLLEKRYKWHGVCVEADPKSFQDLSFVRSVPCFNICVDSQEGEVDFVQRFLFSGIIDESTDNKRRPTETKRHNVLRLKTKTLSSILETVNAPRTIDYLSIDVEGSEDRILSDFPFNNYKFLCMTVERPKPHLRKVLAQNGYLVIKEIPNFDVFYIHESFLENYERNLLEFWAKAI